MITHYSDFIQARRFTAAANDFAASGEGLQLIGGGLVLPGTDSALRPPLSDDDRMDDAVRNYIDAMAPEHRPLFDRLHRLILEAHPEATVVISYQIPTYKVGRRRLYVGVWKHGVSIYGWDQGADGGFTARHPELKTGRGTLQLRPAVAAGIPDEELRDLVHAALDA